MISYSPHRVPNGPGNYPPNDKPIYRGGSSAASTDGAYYASFFAGADNGFLFYGPESTITKTGGAAATNGDPMARLTLSSPMSSAYYSVIPAQSGSSVCYPVSNLGVSGYGTWSASEFYISSTAFGSTSLTTQAYFHAVVYGDM